MLAVIIAAFIIVAVAVLVVTSVLVARRTHRKSGASGDLLDWRKPLFAAVGTSVLLLSMIVYSPYLDFLYIFLLAPCVCLFCVVLLIWYTVRKRPGQCLSTLFALITFLATSALILENEDAIRASFRWTAWSRQFKAEVLGPPAPANGELRHMVWEATGFAGVANNTVYVVFDPSDALSAAHLPGKVAGIPCTVFRTQRLERHWYAVWFYTDESWSECPWSIKASGR